MPSRRWWERLHLRVGFVPRDLWFGIYVGPLRAGYRETFVCLVPTLPIIVRWDVA